MPLLSVDGAELYHEVRGDGPPVLLIMGMTGDGGHFDTLADVLADEFTVVTYDRRGNGRSPRPPGWTQTSPEEQADDAAALLVALGLSPAAVYGSSSGGTFALCLLVRHPEAVRGAVLHEAALIRLFDAPEARGELRALVEEALDAGGEALVVERLWRRISGDASWDRLPVDLRERMQANAATFVGVELGSYEGFLPDDRTLAAITAPVLVLVSEQGGPLYAQAAGRLAARLGVAVTRTPGTHSAYHDHPDQLADTLRAFLREVSTAARTR